MKIVYIALKYDNGIKERGYSFEHYNFHDSLVKMNNGEHHVIYFPFDEIQSEVGNIQMNQQLIEVVNREKPDLCFFFLFSEEIEKATIREITEKSGSITFNWFADDHWRFDNFSKYYAPCFHFVSTTDSHAVEKYHSIGYRSVIKTQWGCNHFLYSPNKETSTNSAYKYDVSFVGQPHGDRDAVIRRLAKQGITVECFGLGWPNGRVSQETMIEIFQTSRINLNMTKSSIGWTLKGIAHIFLKKRSGRIIVQHPKDIWGNIRMFFSGRREQIKGRNFEVPGCGGFILTGNADNLGDYYADGREISIFENEDALSDKIKYYLNHDNERERVRQAGHRRTIEEHTYEKRFNDLFAQVMNKHNTIKKS